MRILDPLESPVSGLLAWSMAALTCTQRLLADHQTRPQRSADALLLMLSLRNLVRAADWVANTVQGSPQEVARRQAVADFRHRLPDVVNARDVLEHFDDYATGQGRIQQRAARDGRVPATYALAVAIEDGAPVIGVGPYRFGVLRARDACRELTIMLLALEELSDRSEAETLTARVEDLA
ncbi:hypothetical protein [Phytohabitans houttuyneae]|uniref:hypothetical protein n=1 Tax=Phytohabitans houttuyneae TaxID=1076126 RepID=UPI0031F06D66